MEACSLRSAGISDPPFRIVGKAGDPGANGQTAEYVEVSEDYFKTMGIPLLRGRVFAQTDGETAPGVAVINPKFLLALDRVSRTSRC